MKLFLLCESSSVKERASAVAEAFRHELPLIIVERVGDREVLVDCVIEPLNVIEMVCDKASKMTAESIQSNTPGYNTLNQFLKRQQ